MELSEKHCWAEIDVGAIKHNYNLIKDTFGRPFYTVVKADAYGHGARFLGRVYQELDTFGLCVSSFSEAMELRYAGVSKPILILGYTDPSRAYDLFKNNLTQVIFSLDYARQLNDNALYPIECHVKLDTGMGRLGFDLIGDKEAAFSDIRRLLSLHNLKITGMFSHFPAADSLGERELLYTQRQLDLFAEAVRLMDSWGFNLKVLHGQNSAGIARKLDGVFNTMRAGIILYGEQPSGEVIMPQLKKTMVMKTIVTQIKAVKAGQFIGYGMQFCAEKDCIIATLASGYADGVPRQLSYTGYSVCINDKFYPLSGRVCMDQMMIDVSGGDVNVGDEVRVLGGEGETSFDTVAQKTMTVNCEVLCGIGKRVPRLYKENGKILHIQYGI
ncbi:MAG: alanine racemase [Oscillospiraceae bacterium]